MIFKFDLHVMLTIFSPCLYAQEKHFEPIFPLWLFDLQWPCSICGGDYQDGVTELVLPVACTGLLLVAR